MFFFIICAGFFWISQIFQKNDPECFVNYVVAHICYLDFYCFFRFRIFCDFFVCAWCLRKWEQMSSFMFHFQFIWFAFWLFRTTKIRNNIETWRIGTEMTLKWKLKLDICSHFYTPHTHKKIAKRYETGKNNTSYLFFCHYCCCL